MNEPPWFISMHAIGRMREMEVTRREVTDALDPRKRETDYQSHKNYGTYGSQCRVSTRGRIAVVYHPERREVVTVLWAGREGREDRPKTTRGDRPPRGESG